MIILIFVVCLIVSVVIGTAGVVLYLIYWPIKKWLIRTGKLSKQCSRIINRVYISVLLLLIIYFTHYLFYPPESFYAEEFKTVTLKELPASAEFISKSSSYPDFHGDYSSSAAIKLSPDEYLILLNELKVDDKMTKNGEQVFFKEFEETLDGRKASTIIERFTRSALENNYYLFIGFCDDKQTVFVNICKY